jgi:hypothetical protein
MTEKAKAKEREEGREREGKERLTKQTVFLSFPF